MYMYAHPGKKLNFMGNEFGQFREWSEEREQDWQILQYPLHDAFQKYITKLNEIYLKNPALHSGEYNMDNFRWIMSDNCEQCVYIFERSCGGVLFYAYLFFRHETGSNRLLWEKPQS